MVFKYILVYEMLSEGVYRARKTILTKVVRVTTKRK